MAGVLYCSKSKNKIRMEFSSIENAEIRYHGGFTLSKMLKYGTTKVRPGSNIVQKAKIS